MNNLEDNASAAADLKETCENLRRQVNLLLGGLMITSFTLTAYLGLQARRASAELAVVQPRAEQSRKLMDQDDASAEGIYTKLGDFAKTHPDYQNRIFSKYKMNGKSPEPGPKK
jgi:hypothetical protein